MQSSAWTCYPCVSDQTGSVKWWRWYTSPLWREGQCSSFRCSTEIHVTEFCFCLCPGVFLSNPTQAISLTRSSLSVHPCCRWLAAFQRGQGRKKCVCDGSSRRNSSAEQSSIQAVPVLCAAGTSDTEVNCALVRGRLESSKCNLWRLGMQLSVKWWKVWWITALVHLTCASGTYLCKFTFSSKTVLKA